METNFILSSDGSALRSINWLTSIAVFGHRNFAPSFSAQVGNVESFQVLVRIN